VSRVKAANSGYQAAIPMGKQKSKPREEQILSLASFSASTPDNALTLLLDNELDLSSTIDIRMPEINY
jgi:hypothetical protein